MLKKLSIDSDFRDWYDLVFYPIGPDTIAINRLMQPRTHKGLNKEGQFNILEDSGFLVPEHGLKSEIKERTDYLVLYSDLYAHCGEGKLLAHFEDVRDHSYVSAYVGGRFGTREYGLSKRILKLGVRYFIYDYKSRNDWRSNCGDVYVSPPKEVEIYKISKFLKEECSLSKLLKHTCLWAIDLVLSTSGKWYAVDYNKAPGTKHTGIENLLSATEVYDSMLEFWEL